MVIGKIDGVGSTRATQNVKRAAKSSASDGAGFAKHLDETSESSPVSGTNSVGSVAGVFGLQEVDDATARASKGKQRGLDILDRLDEIRMAILTGGLSKDRLLQLTRMVAARRADVKDPRLAEILDEIDLRAQVELAKYTQGR